MAEAKGPAWAVTAQREAMEPDATGAYVAGYVVSFTTAAGHPGSVFVPMRDYTVEKVRALIAARAVTIDAVGELTS